MAKWSTHTSQINGPHDQPVTDMHTSGSGIQIRQIPQIIIDPPQEEIKCQGHTDIPFPFKNTDSNKICPGTEWDTEKGNQTIDALTSSGHDNKGQSHESFSLTHPTNKVKERVISPCSDSKDVSKGDDLSALDIKGQGHEGTTILSSSLKHPTSKVKEKVIFPCVNSEDVSTGDELSTLDI